jgi:hypothetical protein
MGALLPELAPDQADEQGRGMRAAGDQAAVAGGCGKCRIVVQTKAIML